MFRWAMKALPSPVEKDFNTQLGVHLEEIAESLDPLKTDNPLLASALTSLVIQMKAVSKAAKTGTDIYLFTEDRIEFLDGLADQIQTACAVAHTLKMDLVSACAEVASSNYSKFKDGEPIFDENRKVMKNPDTYFKPDLTNFI